MSHTVTPARLLRRQASAAAASVPIPVSPEAAAVGSAGPPSGDQPARKSIKPKSSQTRAEYRPDIDGIRGAAAIMVMGFHAKVPGFEGSYIGLDLFFVVSGYVITGLLMQEYERTGAIRWGTFYARRARRLIPAKATMLLGVLVLSYFVMSPTGAAQSTAKSAAAAASFVSNFFFWQSSNINYFSHEPGTGVLLHTWSLSVEEQFYLSLPIALLISYGLARLLKVPAARTLLFTTVALGLASAWLAITWAGSHPEAAYYLPISRAFEFLMGVGLALVARKITLAPDFREVMGLAGVAMIAYVLWRPLPVDGYPSYFALVPCVASVLMVWAGVGGATAVTRFLSMRFLVVLGLVSYGWYLWHWPFLVFGESINLSAPPLWARVLLIFAALGMAALSYRYVEGVFYKRSGTVSTRTRVPWHPRRVIISGVLAMATVAALAGGAVAWANDRSESPQWARVSAELDDAPAMPSECLEGDEIIPSQPVECHLTPYVEGQPTVVLWGDSHAWMYIPALEAASRERDVNLVAFVMGRCPPADPKGTGIGGACSRSNSEALAYVRAMSKTDTDVRVVVGASWSTYRGEKSTTVLAEGAEGAAVQAAADFLERMNTLFAEGTPQLFDDLARRHVPVDVVGPTAFLTRSAPLCEASSHPYSCDLSRTAAIPNEAADVSWIKGLMQRLPKSSRYIDVSNTICDSETCFAERDGLVNYFDDNHLSATLSTSLGKYFEPTIKALAPASPVGDPSLSS